MKVDADTENFRENHFPRSPLLFGLFSVVDCYTFPKTHANGLQAVYYQ